MNTCVCAHLVLQTTCIHRQVQVRFITTTAAAAAGGDAADAGGVVECVLGNPDRSPHHLHMINYAGSRSAQRNTLTTHI